jgi:hypothetical protein
VLQYFESCCTLVESWLVFNYTLNIHKLSHMDLYFRGFGSRDGNGAPLLF